MSPPKIFREISLFTPVRATECLVTQIQMDEVVNTLRDITIIFQSNRIPFERPKIIPGSRSEANEKPMYQSQHLLLNSQKSATKSGNAGTLNLESSNLLTTMKLTTIKLVTVT